jgi:hypothetical protein
MTGTEKKEYPHYSVTTGFLRVFGYKQAWKKSFDEASQKDVEKTVKLPNFSYKLFEEITGITEEMFKKKFGVQSQEKRK